jgi:sterol desaturase/sphingolipid hydroxylase (fatty acid hydroxylase superfamily)
MSWFTQAYDALFTWLFANLMQPLLFGLGLMNYWDEAYLGTETVLLGALEITLLAVIVVPLEKWRPFEAQQDTAAVRTDFAYTLINRLGLLPLFLFTITLPVESAIDSLLHEHGITRITLETLAPTLMSNPLVAFFSYLVLFDFLGYWIHRGQHRFLWWWQLHAVHHSQRAMSVWTESRNHYLDDVLVALLLVLAARLAGTPATQFIWLMFASRLIESVSHANWRTGYGALVSRVIVDPHFHRIHHAIGLGHEGRARGLNFAVLLPLWDILFGTARFGRTDAQTGIRDQLDGRDYGRSLIAQQWIGLKALVRAVLRPSALS